MNNNDSIGFPCTACGLCCRFVGHSPMTSFLDRGDGACRHFDTKTNLCTIYEERPLVCRVQDYYDAKLSGQYSWAKFVEMNVKICHELQKKYQDLS